MRERKKKTKKEQEGAKTSIQEGDGERVKEGAKNALIQVVIRLLVITCLIVGPYAGYILSLRLRLQTTAFGGARGIVSPTTARQLLVVGTQSSGTTGVAKELRGLGLEIGHETSDAEWEFARDGTVSWFHGLRFLPRPERKAFVESVGRLCSRSWDHMGFHPAMYRPPRRGCSYRRSWDSCWVQECAEILEREWGCAMSGDADDDARLPCETPFVRSLVQFRDPLRVAESLAVKFCPSLSEPPHNSFVVFAEALFGATFSGAGGEPPDRASEWARSTECAEVVGWYAIRYYEAVFDALDAGVIDGSYAVDGNRSVACEAARLGGFLGSTKPQWETASSRCRSQSDGEAAVAPPARVTSNKRNLGLVRFTAPGLAASFDTGRALALRAAALVARAEACGAATPAAARPSRL